MKNRKRLGSVMSMAKKTTETAKPKAKKLQVFFMPDGRSVQAENLKEAMDLFSNQSK